MSRLHRHENQLLLQLPYCTNNTKGRIYTDRLKYHIVLVDRLAKLIFIVFISEDLLTSGMAVAQYSSYENCGGLLSGISRQHMEIIRQEFRDADKNDL